MKIIIFDLDGVISNSTEHVSKMLFDIYPKMTMKVMYDLLSGNFHEKLEIFKKDNPSHLTEDERKKYFEEYTKKKSKIALYVGIKELLQTLHDEGYTLMINTSAYDRNCLPILENHKIRDLFSFIATAEISKSKIEKFKIIQDKFNINKKDILFVTDTFGDVKEAREERINTIAVTWGVYSREQFKNESFDNVIAIVDSVSELKEVIGKYFTSS